jgi:hypothetical protein
VGSSRKGEPGEVRARLINATSLLLNASAFITVEHNDRDTLAHQNDVIDAAVATISVRRILAAFSP